MSHPGRETNKPAVLIFSGSVKLLKMLQGFIQREREYTTCLVDEQLTVPIDNCETLHGGVKDDERMAAVDRFQTDPNVFVFLISKCASQLCISSHTDSDPAGTLAGGVGLNLTAVSLFFAPNSTDGEC
jgi:hypothetical protein